MSAAWPGGSGFDAPGVAPNLPYYPAAPFDGSLRPRRTTADDLPFALRLITAMALAGVVLGLVWSAWSPAGPRALVVRPGVLIPDESETFVAGDGRFLVLVALAGAVAGGFTWMRVHRRGPLVVLALALGGLAGAALTELVGHLSGGGTFDGAANTLIRALPLSLHIPGAVLVEAVAALMVYGLFVAFAVHDDLGHDDPVRAALHSRTQTSPAPAPAGAPATAHAAGSVGAGDHPQYGGRHGDAPGLLQQRDLPPQ